MGASPHERWCDDSHMSEWQDPTSIRLIEKCNVHKADEGYLVNLSTLYRKYTRSPYSWDWWYSLMGSMLPKT